MRRPFALVIAASLFALLSCESNSSGNGNGGDGNGNTTVVTVTASPNLVDDEGRFFAINEVGLGPDGFVALTNFTEVPASLGGLYLCQGSDCAELPDAEVKKGTTAIVAMGGGDGLDGVVLTDAGLGLQPADGEVGLYASEESDNPDDIRAYVQWGSTPHDGTAAAIEAGLWLEDAFVESAPDASLIYRSESGEWVFE